MRGALLLAVLAATVAAAATSAAAVPTSAGDPVLAPVDSLEADLLGLVNAARRARALPALRLSRSLAAAADAHSRTLARRGLFAHRLPGGPTIQGRVRRFYRAAGFRRWSVGENLVAMSPMLTAGEALRLWLRSPGHRRNLLLPRWREIGLGAVHATAAPGVWGGSDVTIVTADLGVRR